MENNIRIDDSLIKEVVFGRVEPKIYAFETDTIPKYLKVGDTFRSVDERLNEWKHYGFVDLRKVDDWSSEIPGKDLYFRDYSVHSYLLKNGKERLTRDVFADKPFSNEFFKNASKDDVVKAIEEIIGKVDCENSEYVYYSVFDRAPTEEHFERDINEWTPRKPLQTDAIENFKKAIDNNQNNLLMYAVMRFGKSFTSLCCAKAMNAKLVLVVSGKADVATEWKENVERPGQFKNFVFLNTKNLRRNDCAISKAQSEGKTIVLFLTLQDLAKEKRRFAELFSQEIDLMIIDETHFAARADTLGKVIRDTKLPEDTALSQQVKSDGIKDESLGGVDSVKAQNELKNVSEGLKVKVKLHLSGTPYRILLGSEFKPEDRISFCQYSDIIEQKEKWYAENIAGNKQEETGKEEWDNPYYGFPEMVRFAFSLNDSAKIKMQQLEEEGYTSRLSALFAPKSVTKTENNEHKQFVYKQEILDFLQTIDGTKADENVLGFLDNERIKSGELCHHIVMVLPFCASCDAMETLIKENSNLFKNLNDYEIINISGTDTTYNKIPEVKNKISDCEKGKDSSGKRKTLTLTVNRMLTGCTVPEWDTMIFLKDTSSPQDYDQAVFRLQSPFITEYRAKDKNGEQKIIRKDMKPQTLLVDFDPQRMFYLQETKSRVYNINTEDAGNDESEKRIKKELEISPILHISANKLVKVQPSDILKAVSEYSTNRGITEAANDIIVDETLMNVDEIRTIIDKEFEIGSGKGLAEQAYPGGETGLAPGDIKTTGTPGDKKDGKESKDTNNKKEAEPDIKVFVKKCRSYYRRILFYAFFCKSEKEIKNLTEIIKSLENSENKRIFDHLGMDKNFILLMQEKMNGVAKRSLDDKIYDLYRLSHEYEQDDVDPIKRATTAIQKFGKISDSEVVTPQKIAGEMVNLIPETDFIDAFDNGHKFLDIASKMGEFTVALYRRAESLGIPKDKIYNSIYSIPTSNLAYEFTRFVYEKLGLNISNLAGRFNSYDLLKIKKKIKKGKNAGKVTKENDYEKICAILSQSKPFSEITIDDENTEGDEKVNFDVVVGNPPYQVSDGGAQASARPIYQNFVTVSKILSLSYITIVMPSRWYAGGKGLDDFRTDMLNDSHIEELHDFLHPEEVFPDTNNRGGVCYFLRNSFYDNGQNLVNVVTHNGNGETYSAKRSIKTGDLDIFVRSNQAIEIMKKVITSDGCDVLSSHISAAKAFGFRTFFINDPLFRDKKNGLKDPILCYGRSEKEGYVERTDIRSHSDWIDLWKVYVPESNNIGTELNDDNQNAFVGCPKSICTETFLVVGADLSLNQVEANNLCSYLKTKFARFLLSLAKISQHGTAKTYCFVPIQDFSRPWTDADLYAKYGLTPEEIAFIESTIKPME